MLGAHPTPMAHRHLTSTMSTAGVSVFSRLSKWNLPLPVTHPNTWQPSPSDLPSDLQCFLCILHSGCIFNLATSLFLPSFFQQDPCTSLLCPKYHPFQDAPSLSDKSPSPCPEPTGPMCTDVLGSPCLCQVQFENPIQGFPSLTPLPSLPVVHSTAVPWIPPLLLKHSFSPPPPRL